MEYKNIRVEQVNGQYRLTLDRSGKPNPINRKTFDELNHAIDRFENSDECHVFVMTGTNNAFATGADISNLVEWTSVNNWDSMMEFVREGQLLTNRIDDIESPTIAAINGYALGGGLEFALAFDLRFASEEAILGFPEIDLAMLPGWGGTQRLPDVVGKSTAKDMLLTGKRLNATEAQKIGLVDKVFEDDELIDKVDEYSETLAEKPAKTMNLILEAVEVGAEGPLHSGLSYELMNDMFSAFTDEAEIRTKKFFDQ